MGHAARDHTSPSPPSRPSAEATAVRRSSSDGGIVEDDKASPFIADWIARLATGNAPRSALDVAMGRGRHAIALALAGFRVFGVDARFDAVRDAAVRAGHADVVLRAWCADLTQHPLPASRFDVIVVTRYLQRDLFPALRRAARPGGVILYETFTTAQRALGVGPKSPDHLLEPGELRRAFDGFDVLFYEEVTAPEAVARIAARSRE